MIAVQHSINDDRIFYKEALSLLKNGYEVSYLLLGDNDGMLKEMDGNIVEHDKDTTFYYHGIKILTIAPPTKFNALLNKIFLGSFQQRIIKTILNEKADIYHAHEPISFRFALKASYVSKKKVIFDSHESWVGGTIKDRLIKLKYLKKIQYLITVNQGILSKLKEEGQFKRSEVIYNCSHPLLFPTTNKQSKINNPIRLVHEGSLTFNRGLKTIMQSFRLLQNKYPSIKLKIIGDSPDKEKKYISRFVSKNNLENNFEMRGWLKYENVSKNMEDCDIGLIMYVPTKNNLYSTSNKLFNYIASGLAIVSVDIPETTRILSTLNNNIIIENYRVSEVVGAISLLIENPKGLLQKKIASCDAYDKYNWNKEEKKLLKFYRKVIND